MRLFSNGLLLSKRTVRRYLEIYENNELMLKMDERYRQKKTELMSRTLIAPSRLAAFIEETKAIPYTTFRYGQYYPAIRKAAGKLAEAIKLEGYLYLPIHFFGSGISEKIGEILERSGNVKGLILDLRNNSGGVVEECVRIARLLLPSCSIAELNYPGKIVTFLSDEKRHSFGRLFILVNEYSASCSEIMALTLRMHLKEAMVIGERTACKNIGQRTFNHRRKRRLFSVSSFQWSVEKENSSLLQEYLKSDNPQGGSFKSNDDYFRRILQMIQRESGEREAQAFSEIMG
ncbi:S41 family peptidase [Paenibacillus zanthoxyli]|uniref:S41 family peptidase n=1 Tax=Paenibacillus zanthoxyli TaxID=369399 RepID=UPI00046F3C69|nr:S41 family peptidase [Paenibacillus zanthoxyli]